MKKDIEQAFILTAGKGTRLRPYTDDTPKPMVEICGKPILTYTLEKLKQVGVQHVTMNLFYLGDKIKNYFTGYASPKVAFSQENELLDTGGGVKNALHHMNNQDFYLINGDALWDDVDGAAGALEQLSQQWNPSKMDILLLLQPVDKMKLTKGFGDYDMNPDGTVTRSLDKTGSHMFTGIRIVKPTVFDDTPDGAFSFLECMDRAQESGTLHGVEYTGQWHHISTPEDLENVNKAYADINKRRTAEI